MLLMSMRESYCCTSSGSPPSPINLAPRMITSPEIFRNHPSKGKDIKLWSATNVIEDPKPLKATVFSRVFRRIKPKKKTPLEILIQENTKSDTDYSVKEAESKILSSVLKKVAEKVKEHLRTESTLSSRESRPSVGTSDEDVERRAELRRIRKQRIREELSQESEYDLDAKSLPSIVDGLGISILGLDLSKLTTPNFRYPALNNCKEQVSDVSSESKARIYSKNLSPSATSSQKLFHEALGHSNILLKKRHHLIDLPSANQASISSKPQCHPRKFSPLPSIPSGPLLRPKRLPSISESNNSSWQLIFEADNKNQNFGGQKRQISGPDTLKSKRSQLLVSKNNDDILVLKQMNLNQQPGKKKVSIRDNTDTPTAIHLHQLGISQQLTSPFRSYSSSSSSQLQIQKLHRQESLRISENYGDTCSRYTPTSGSMSPEFQGSSGTFFDEIPSFADLIFDDGVPFSPQGSLSDFFSIQENPSSIIEESKTPDATQEYTSSRSMRMTNLPFSNLILPQEKMTSNESSIIIDIDSLEKKQERAINPVRSRLTLTSASSKPIKFRSGKFHEEFNIKPILIDVNASQSHSSCMELSKNDCNNSNYNQDANVKETLDVSNPLNSEEKKVVIERHLSSNNGAAAKLREFAGNFRTLSERSGNCPRNKPASENCTAKDNLILFSAFKKDSKKKSDLEKLSIKTEERNLYKRKCMEPEKIQKEGILFKAETEYQNSNLGNRYISSAEEKSFPFPRLTGDKDLTSVEKFGLDCNQGLKKIEINDYKSVKCFENQHVHHQTQAQGLGDKKKYKPRFGRQIGRLAHKYKVQDRLTIDLDHKVNRSPELLNEPNFSKLRTSIFSAPDCMSRNNYHEEEIEEEFRRISLIENIGNRSHSSSSSISNYLFHSNCTMNQEKNSKSLERRKLKTWGGKDGERNIYIKRKSLS